MTPDLTNQVTVGLLILTVATVILTSLLLFLLTSRYSKKNLLFRGVRWPGPDAPQPENRRKWRPAAFGNPCRWFAIRSSNLTAVQASLHLQNPTPCTWGDGISKLTEHLFISPPIQGWILLIGQGLPDPAEDVDKCFHLAFKLSREFGQVQFFSSDRPVNHHAWVRMEDGRVQRAYAWAGRTVWNQGALTRAETELDLRCFVYGEETDALDVSVPSHQCNAEKVNSLAARWSLDPAALNEGMLSGRLGIAGDLIHSRQH